MADDVIDDVSIFYIAITFAFGRNTNGNSSITSIISHCIFFHIMQLFDDASRHPFFSEA